MLLSTQTEGIASRLGDAEAVKILCEAGFDALDYSMFRFTYPDNPLDRDGFKEHVRSLRDAADRYGVTFNQSHAPFPSCIEGNDDYNRITLGRIVRALEASSILGVRIMVVHPSYYSDTSSMKERNLDFYRRLQPYCEEYNVKVALENMWGRDAVTRKIIPNVCSTGETFADYLDGLDSRFFTACLDLGHSGLVGSDAASMIRALGHDRLKALHVHDNDFINDTHTAPFYGMMDWDSIIGALRDIGYDGDFTFEADNFYQRVPAPLLPQAAGYLQQIGRYFLSALRGKA